MRSLFALFTLFALSMSELFTLSTAHYDVSTRRLLTAEGPSYTCTHSAWCRLRKPNTPFCNKSNGQCVLNDADKSDKTDGVKDYSCTHSAWCRLRKPSTPFCNKSTGQCVLNDIGNKGGQTDDYFCTHSVWCRLRKPSTPFCNKSTGQCVLNDTDDKGDDTDEEKDYFCTHSAWCRLRKPSTPQCDKTFGKCVAYLKTETCTDAGCEAESPMTPMCHSTTGTCFGCSSKDDCDICTGADEDQNCTDYKCGCELSKTPTPWQFTEEVKTAILSEFSAFSLVSTIGELCSAPARSILLGADQTQSRKELADSVRAFGTVATGVQAVAGFNKIIAECEDPACRLFDNFGTQALQNISPLYVYIADQLEHCELPEEDRNIAQTPSRRLLATTSECPLDLDMCPVCDPSNTCGLKTSALVCFTMGAAVGAALSPVIIKTTGAIGSVVGPLGTVFGIEVGAVISGVLVFAYGAGDAIACAVSLDSDCSQDVLACAKCIQDTYASVTPCYFSLSCVCCSRLELSYLQWYWLFDESKHSCRCPPCPDNTLELNQIDFTEAISRTGLDTLVCEERKGAADCKPAQNGSFQVCCSCDLTCPDNLPVKISATNNSPSEQAAAACNDPNESVVCEDLDPDDSSLGQCCLCTGCDASEFFFKSNPDERGRFGMTPELGDKGGWAVEASLVVCGTVSSYNCRDLSTGIDGLFQAFEDGPLKPALPTRSVLGYCCICEPECHPLMSPRQKGSNYGLSEEGYSLASGFCNGSDLEDGYVQKCWDLGVNNTECCWCDSNRGLFID